MDVERPLSVFAADPETPFLLRVEAGNRTYNRQSNLEQGSGVHQQERGPSSAPRLCPRDQMHAHEKFPTILSLCFLTPDSTPILEKGSISIKTYLTLDFLKNILTVCSHLSCTRLFDLDEHSKTLSYLSKLHCYRSSEYVMEESK